MLNFGKLYDIISDEEKKSIITYLIKEMPLKSIEFNFPIYRDGKEVRKILWESGNTVETVVLMSKKDCFLQILFATTFLFYNKQIRDCRSRKK